MYKAVCGAGPPSKLIARRAGSGLAGGAGKVGCVVFYGRIKRGVLSEAACSTFRGFSVCLAVVGLRSLARQRGGGRCGIEDARAGPVGGGERIT